MATLWVASYTVGDEGGRHILPQGGWSQLAVLERVVLLNLRRWWRKFGRQVERTYMAAVYYELGAAAGISYLLGTTEQVVVQCPLLGGAADVDRQSRETNVLHVRWWNAVQSTVRKIRVGIEDGVLHALEALAERSALIRQHIVSAVIVAVGASRVSAFETEVNAIISLCGRLAGCGFGI